LEYFLAPFYCTLLPDNLSKKDKYIQIFIRILSTGIFLAPFYCTLLPDNLSKKRGFTFKAFRRISASGSFECKPPFFRSSKKISKKIPGQKTGDQKMYNLLTQFS